MDDIKPDIQFEISNKKSKKEKKKWKSSCL
jgi:hypothetical protein